MYNSVAHVRTSKGQKNYLDWERKVILAVNGEGVTSEQLAHVIPRTAISIANHACLMGVSLAATKRSNKAEANNKIFSLVESLGLATTRVLIDDSGICESTVRASLRYLVGINLIKYKMNKIRGYVYYI